MQIARKNYNLTLIVRGYREAEPQIKAPIVTPLEGAIHRKVRKDRKAQPQFVTRITRIGWIYTDPRASAQSAFHHVCSSLKNPASGASISAFIRVHPWFFYDVVFQTGLTGCVFNPVILSNLKCRLPVPEKNAKLEEVIDAKS